VAAAAAAVPRWSPAPRSRVPALPRLGPPAALPRCRPPVPRGAVLSGSGLVRPAGAARCGRRGRPGAPRSPVPPYRASRSLPPPSPCASTARCGPRRRPPPSL
ncbi:hypothetical protein C3R44_22015, partial [Mycobacterium tuberculosis]